MFTTQADHKRNMRDSEEWVLNAEKYASLAWLDGKRYPATRFTDAWKHVLFNQFHDLAAGSGIGRIYREAQKDYDQVRWSTNEIKQSSLETLAAQVDTRVKHGVPVLVVNPLAWQRGGTVEAKVQFPSGNVDEVSVEDADGKPLASQVVSTAAQPPTPPRILVDASSVPSMGYAVLRVNQSKPKFTSDLMSTGTTLENSRLRVVIDPQTGCITSACRQADQLQQHCARRLRQRAPGL